jgi:hypothetical protein
MKSKNKFAKNLSNNFFNNDLVTSIKNFSNNVKNKNTNTINVIVIFLIIGFSIYLLYFDDKIYVQDSIMNSLNQKEGKEGDYFVENFDVSKYEDICKSRNTQFYNVVPNPTPIVAANIDECERKCTDTSCDIFTFRKRDNKCFNYKKIEPRNVARAANPIRINCNTQELPIGKYNVTSQSDIFGIGYINKVYFKNNKTDLSYIDPFLIESQTVLRDLYSIDADRNQLDNLNYSDANFATSYETISDRMQTTTNALFRRFDTMNPSNGTGIFDNSRNKLYTDIYKNSDISNSILTTQQSDPNYEDYVKNKYTIAEKSKSLDGILDALSENFITNNVRYLILAVIMIITIIMLLLYKSSNSIINEKILIAYVIFTTFLVLFITHHLKL